MRISKDQRFTSSSRNIYEINIKAKYYEQYAKTLGFKDIKDLTATAIRTDNLEAIIALAPYKYLCGYFRLG